MSSIYLTARVIIMSVSENEILQEIWKTRSNAAGKYNRNDAAKRRLANKIF